MWSSEEKEIIKKMSKLEWLLAKVKKTFPAISSVRQRRGTWLLQRRLPNTERGANSTPPPESCWERMKKWGRRLQTITCSKSKVAHQRIHRSFGNNVKVKVICILHDDPASRPCVGFSVSLIFANAVQIFVCNVVALIWHVFFFPHIILRSDLNEVEKHQFETRVIAALLRRAAL